MVLIWVNGAISIKMSLINLIIKYCINSPFISSIMRLEANQKKSEGEWGLHMATTTMNLGHTFHETIHMHKYESDQKIYHEKGLENEKNTSLDTEIHTKYIQCTIVNQALYIVIQML